MSKFDSEYKAALRRIRDTGVVELNRRTGHAVRALPGVQIQTDLEDDGFPLLSLRKMPWSFIPEVMWMLSGQKDATWLSGYTKIWDSFKEEDGTVASAYGFRMRHAFGVDQLGEILVKLENDSSDRHGVVQIWDAADDLTVPKKNVPCPVMFTVNVIQGRLNLHLIVRSNDMVLGHPTDVAGFALIQTLMAQRLHLMPGVFTVSISNAHIYENQLPFVDQLLERETETDEVRLTIPRDSWSRANGLDPELIGEIKQGFHGYHPGEAMKNIPIAL